MNKYKKNYIVSSHKYFELFGSYDLQELRNMYDTNIHLIDWNGQWVGIESVLEMNQNLFKEKPIIKVLEIIQSDKEFDTIQRTYCKIQIEINGITLKVLDIIDWNDNHTISKIEAFNG